MITLRSLGLFAVPLLLAFAGPAKATLTWEYTVSGEELSGSGFIEFSTASSSDLGAAVLGFEWQGQTFGLDWGCSGMSCLASASWSIAPDWSLGSIQFVINPTIIDVPPFYLDQVLLSPDAWLFAPPGGVAAVFCESLGAPSCGGLPSDRAFSSAAEAAPVHVPEPSTLTLFAGGLFFLGLLSRRRQKII